MKNTTRRVLILKNVKSHLIEQAILILRDSAHSEDSAALREAEKIVEKYMGKKKQNPKAEKRFLPMVLLYSGMGIFVLSLVAVVFFV